MRITPRAQLPTHTVIAHDAEYQKKDCELRITFATAQKISARKKLFPNSQSLTMPSLIFFKKQQQQ